MGLLLLERKESSEKYTQLEATAEASDLLRRREQAAHATALAEAKKREESLKKALGVEKECISSVMKSSLVHNLSCLIYCFFSYSYGFKLMFVDRENPA